MTSEEWRVIDRNPKYEVSNLGGVRSYANFQGTSDPEPHPLKPDIDCRGYPRVRLWDRGKTEKVFVHVLVAEAFLGDRPEGAILVRHIDGDPANPRWDNLEYGTHKDNEADKLRHGTRVWGERSHLSKLTEAQVVEIRRNDKSNAVIAKDYGVTRQLVWQIKTNRIWKWIQ